jgi:hypothetical protein
MQAAYLIDNRSDNKRGTTPTALRKTINTNTLMVVALQAEQFPFLPRITAQFMMAE